MTDAGDIHLADLNDERRHRVLVMSNRRFNRMSGRVLVAPAIPGKADEVPFPWRIEVDGDVYAVDLLRSITIDRLLDQLGTAPHDAVTAVRRAIAHVC